MTTRHIAEKLDIVPATVMMYENGKHPTPYDVAVKLADILEIEASLLYDGRKCGAYLRRLFGEGRKALLSFN